MLTRWHFTKPQKVVFILTLTLTVSLLTVSGVFAVLYDINTNNNSISDWASVPVFQTDPSGDVSSSCSGGVAQDDIIQTYVASGPTGSTPTWIYFRVRTASASAVSTNQHWVGAFVDCTPYGEDNQDTVVFYDPQGDDVYAGDGFKTGEKYTPDNIAFCGQGETGERPADGTDTVEWSCNWDLMTGNPTGANCDENSQAKIKLMTFQVTSGLIPEFVCLYDETTYNGFNIPTVVELNSLSTKENRFQEISGWIIFPSLILAMITGSIGLFLFRKFRTQE